MKRRSNQFINITLPIVGAALLSFVAPTIAHDHNHPKLVAKPTSGKMPHAQPDHSKLTKPKMPDAKMRGHHHHKKIAIPAGQLVPKVSLKIEPDAIKGWNMQITLENFEFTPDRINQESQTTNGHAHLMLNGRKIARLYGTRYHIPKLPQGKNILAVVLNTNQHEELTYQGKPIAGTVIIEVP
ncbi:hypothetical protein IQ266_04720 [filamentous cyanobacterium LEGE 11480]|uniref:Uncharacterized protein n=1 Tax=Romeriopsis navalis LEGE 11480 TaxID=2777977 RepID=A0A928VJU6_9CYAN|nr:hypothetical protein [Romeriopsis navalis]MBE9029063.1 hypothetical protein [Romeriopsis navalis LEGE 11480]